MDYPITWNLILSEGSLLVGNYLKRERMTVQRLNQTEKIKVAAVDLNKTLILSKSGVLHGVDEYDWKWWHENVPIRLRALHNEGYTVIVTSNQGRLINFNGEESSEAIKFKRKMVLVARELGIPLTLFIAGSNDIYRKPRPGIWSVIPSQTGNVGRAIDTEKSFVIGDAAGRAKDHSDSDIHWSMNLGIGFFTPEAFFLGQSPEQLGHKFDPYWYLSKGTNVDIETKFPFTTPESGEQSVVVLSGLPGAGKTTYYRRFLRYRGYERINEGAHGPQDSCLTAANNFLKQGKSVVIDDLNIDPSSRQPWISLAIKHGIPAHALHFTAPVDLCLHNDSVRAFGGPLMNLEQRAVYPRIPFLSLVPNFVPPQIDEGFSSISDVSFVWNGTDEELMIWRKHWL
ncbi:polynucleotide kinase 3 phosphatase-domain-containing protein [Xylogone sp. PMI_703]|nr:polynucleotide kinase 3 phosphatase-domain-containing protein [Xylogone sp. PMI_703]